MRTTYREKQHICNIVKKDNFTFPCFAFADDAAFLMETINKKYYNISVKT